MPMDQTRAVNITSIVSKPSCCEGESWRLVQPSACKQQAKVGGATQKDKASYMNQVEIKTRGVSS